MKPSIKMIRTALWATTSLMEREDMPLRDMVVLLCVLERKDACSAPDIQQALQISQPKVSQIVSRLVAGGLLEKYREGTRVMFVPTEKARTVQKSLNSFLGVPDETAKRDLAE